MSRTAVAVTLVAVCVLAGCSRAASDETAAEAPGPTQAAAPAVECLPVSAGAISGLQWGLDTKNGEGQFTLDAAAAIKNPSSDTSWFVAGRFSGPGVDGAVGVWTTLTDPTDATDAAYNSVDVMAAEFSAYLQPADYSAALPGVDEVTSCLN